MASVPSTTPPTTPPADDPEGLLLALLPPLPPSPSPRPPRRPITAEEWARVHAIVTANGVAFSFFGVVFTIGWFAAGSSVPPALRAFALSVFIGHTLVLAAAAAIIFVSWPTEANGFLRAPIRALSGATLGLLLKDVIVVGWGVAWELVAPPKPVRRATMAVFLSMVGFALLGVWREVWATMAKIPGAVRRGRSWLKDQRDKAQQSLGQVWKDVCGWEAWGKAWSSLTGALSKMKEAGNKVGGWVAAPWRPSPKAQPESIQLTPV